MTRLYNPRADLWTEHFRWNGALLVGTTAIGQTTIDVLEINYPEGVRLRRLLIELGAFHTEIYLSAAGSPTHKGEMNISVHFFGITSTRVGNRLDFPRGSSGDSASLWRRRDRSSRHREP